VKQLLPKLAVTIVTFLGVEFTVIFSIAALTREYDGWEQAAGLITACARSRAQCLVPARGALRGKVLDEVSAAIPRDCVAWNKDLVAKLTSKDFQEFMALVMPLIAIRNYKSQISFPENLSAKVPLITAKIIRSRSYNYPSRLVNGNILRAFYCHLGHTNR
jgi:hypothetical protein